MFFIAKNPITMFKTDTPSTPPVGTRGLFPKEDGWYDVDSDGNVRKLGGTDISTPEGISEELAGLRKIVESLQAKSLVKTISISLPSADWIKEYDSLYYQTVEIEGVTEHSKIDLQPTLDQLTIFYEKDITFVTENEGGVVTIYCIGQKPANDYNVQATITEVEI